MKHSLTQTVQVLLLATIIVIVGAQAVALRALQQDVVTFMRTVDLLGDGEPLVASSAEPVERGNGPSVGTEDAPVTIVAFSDYDCPGCQQLMPALRQMVASAGDKMRLEYRHFPLHERGASLRQALAAECAFRQETFLAATRSPARARRDDARGDSRSGGSSRHRAGGIRRLSRVSQKRERGFKLTVRRGFDSAWKGRPRCSSMVAR